MKLYSRIPLNLLPRYRLSIELVCRSFRTALIFILTISPQLHHYDEPVTCNITLVSLKIVEFRNQRVTNQIILRPKWSSLHKSGTHISDIWNVYFYINLSIFTTCGVILSPSLSYLYPGTQNQGGWIRAVENKLDKLQLLQHAVARLVDHRALVMCLGRAGLYQFLTPARNRFQLPVLHMYSCLSLTYLTYDHALNLMHHFRKNSRSTVSRLDPSNRCARSSLPYIGISSTIYACIKKYALHYRKSRGFYAATIISMQVSMTSLDSVLLSYHFAVSSESFL